MKIVRSLILTSLASIVLSACSLFDGSPQGAEPQGGESSKVTEADLPVDSRVTSATRHTTVDGIEVTWEVPAEETDGFVIRYGSDTAHLDSERVVQISELRRETDSQYGPVYRYVIVGVPPGKHLYVAIAARRGEFISNFSAAIPETKPTVREL
jgi:hypothetical protein